MEQIVDYLNSRQEKMQVPDREAKQIRNHPFMTQLDFFDMQEDQEKQWEEQKKATPSNGARPYDGYISRSISGNTTTYCTTR